MTVRSSRAVVAALLIAPLISGCVASEGVVRTADLAIGPDIECVSSVALEVTGSKAVLNHVTSRDRNLVTGETRSQRETLVLANPYDYDERTLYLTIERTSGGGSGALNGKGRYNFVWRASEKGTGHGAAIRGIAQRIEEGIASRCRIPAFTDKVADSSRRSSLLKVPPLLGP